MAQQARPAPAVGQATPPIIYTGPPAGAAAGKTPPSPGIGQAANPAAGPGKTVTLRPNLPNSFAPTSPLPGQANQKPGSANPAIKPPPYTAAGGYPPPATRPPGTAPGMKPPTQSGNYRYPGGNWQTAGGNQPYPHGYPHHHGNNYRQPYWGYGLGLGLSLLAATNYLNGPYLGDGLGSFGYGSYGGYGYYAGYAGPPVVVDNSADLLVPQQPYNPPLEAPAPVPPPVDDGRARIRVIVPQDDAEVAFDGSRTQQTGTTREFVSPPLERGFDYSYRVNAVWTSPIGFTVRGERFVTVRPGGWAVVDFTEPDRRAVPLGN